MGDYLIGCKTLDLVTVNRTIGGHRTPNYFSALFLSHSFFYLRLHLSSSSPFTFDNFTGQSRQRGSCVPSWTTLAFVNDRVRLLHLSIYIQSVPDHTTHSQHIYSILLCPLHPHTFCCPTIIAFPPFHSDCQLRSPSSISFVLHSRTVSV